MKLPERMAKDNGILCPNCANSFNPESDNDEQLKPIDCDVHYEGEPLICENCHSEIESAYGDSEDEND